MCIRDSYRIIKLKSKFRCDKSRNCQGSGQLPHMKGERAMGKLEINKKQKKNALFQTAFDLFTKKMCIRDSYYTGNAALWQCGISMVYGRASVQDRPSAAGRNTFGISSQISFKRFFFWFPIDPSGRQFLVGDKNIDPAV